MTSAYADHIKSGFDMLDSALSADSSTDFTVNVEDWDDYLYPTRLTEIISKVSATDVRLCESVRGGDGHTLEVELRVGRAEDYPVVNCPGDDYVRVYLNEKTTLIIEEHLAQRLAVQILTRAVEVEK